MRRWGEGHFKDGLIDLEKIKRKSAVPGNILQRIDGLSGGFLEGGGGRAFPVLTETLEEPGGVHSVCKRGMLFTFQYPSHLHQK